jgi:hypothetical protein
VIHPSQSMARVRAIRKFTFEEYQADSAARLLASLLVSPVATFNEVLRLGFSAGFIWARDHHLIVFHANAWKVSKLGREYLVLLERGTLEAERVAFLERARAVVSWPGA